MVTDDRGDGRTVVEYAWANTDEGDHKGETAGSVRHRRRTMGLGERKPVRRYAFVWYPHEI